MILFLTGSSGFIGKALGSRVRFDYCIIRETTKTQLGVVNDSNYVFLSDLPSSIAKTKLPVCVVHVAGAAHLKGDYAREASDSSYDFLISVLSNLRLLGLTRFIYLSSANLSSPFLNDNGNLDSIDYCLMGKRREEEFIKSFCSENSIEYCIIRAPLVYGSRAPANFGSLMKLVQRKIPIPLGAIYNKRSMVALDNLVDLIVTCIDHPKAANQTFLVSDDQDVSTTELLKLMIRAAGKKPWLLPVPMSWLRLAGKLTGKQAVIERLCGNLQVDISHTKDTLGWKPPVTVEEGIKRCFVKEELC